MIKRIAVFLGLVLVVFAAVWQFSLRNNFNLRYPDGWTWTVNSLGYGGLASEETGQFAEGTSLSNEPISVSLRTVSRTNASTDGNQVLIRDHYQSLDPINNDLIWELEVETSVDPITGQLATGENYFLPRNLDNSQTYTIANSSYIGLEMVFQREEVVNGISTYLYAFYGDFDNSAAYTYITLEEGQRVICFDFELEYWAEPNTGEIVKYREWCEGDYVVDSAGERLYALQRWGGETSGDDLILQSNRVGGMLNQYQWINFYIPVTSLVLGMLVLAWGAFSLMQAEQTSATEAKA